MRGGPADSYLCFFCATDWPGKVGGCDGRVSRSCTGVAGARGLFSTRSLWSHFLAVYLQGSETAGGGNVLALTTARTVHVGCKEDEPRSALLH